MSKWALFWLAWATLGALVELISLAHTNSTLSHWVGQLADTLPFLVRASIGAFLLWLIWHWVYDPNYNGPVWIDYVAILIGATLGALADRKRKRKPRTGQ